MGFADVRALLKTLTRTPATAGDFDRAVAPAFNVSEWVTYNLVQVWAFGLDCFTTNYYLCDPRARARTHRHMRARTGTRTRAHAHACRYHDGTGNRTGAFRVIAWDADAYAAHARACMHPHAPAPARTRAHAPARARARTHAQTHAHTLEHPHTHTRRSFGFNYAGSYRGVGSQRLIGAHTRTHT